MQPKILINLKKQSWLQPINILSYPTNSLERVVCNGGHSPIFLCIFVLMYFFFFFWPHCTACGILIPWPGIQPGPMAVKVQSPNHWTAREFPNILFLLFTIHVFFLVCCILYLYLSISPIPFMQLHPDWKTSMLPSPKSLSWYFFLPKRIISIFICSFIPLTAFLAVVIICSMLYNFHRYSLNWIKRCRVPSIDISR